MPLPRPFALVLTADQWRRAAHSRTVLVDDTVQLAWIEPPGLGSSAASKLPAAGLAFDDHCRLFHSQPEAGQVDRLLWGAAEPRPITGLFRSEPPAELGDFAPVTPNVGPLDSPRGLVVDAHERLFVAEYERQRVLVFDLWSQRLLQSIAVPGRPTDLGRLGTAVVVVLEDPDAVVVIDSRSAVQPLDPSMPFAGPARIATTPAREVFILERAGTADARLLSRGRAPLAISGATDLEFLGATDLVVARGPGEEFLRFEVQPGGFEARPPLKATNYDGRGIVRTPDQRVGFWTPQGFRHAVSARLRYRPEGRVTSFRLDSGAFRTVWGRLFLDACLPEGTQLLAHFATSDEVSAEPELDRTPPEHRHVPVDHPQLSAPMPPISLVPEDEEVTQRLHRRETGRELPWTPLPSGDAFATYEAPIRANPGRYLWVTLRLLGNSRVTPRFRALRAEYPSHDLLRRLPRTFSRDATAAEFTRRFLALFDGSLTELDGEASRRHALIDPQATPAEALPWLAGFLGLVLDTRWPVAARRQLIKEATWLFRFRGTVPGLQRFLEICLGRSVVIIEKYRARGLGGALVGESSAWQANSVLGAGFRVGGAMGVETPSLASGSVAGDAFATHAHRFTVIIPLALDPERMAAVQHLLEVHRPAHTLVDVCTVAAGMRVGHGLHLELTSLIGRTSGFRALQIENALLGTDAILGRPAPGTRPDESRLQRDSRAG
ncbi:MAG: hypothetical protein IT580_16220 [Verrucomicrobiales bacterium]|nr:hypothetical protein [Verrucomicrobiales bacterium]